MSGIPEGSTINDTGTVRAPGDFYHFRRLVFPLDRARSLADIENYPVPRRWFRLSTAVRV